MANVEFLNVQRLRDDEEIHGRYARIRPLGSGFFGETYEVVDLKDPQMGRYAMKVQMIMTGSEAAPSGDDPMQDSRRLYKEAVILNRILPKHRNILTMKDLLASPHYLYIVTELCERGKDMAAFCPVADNTTGRRIFRQLVEAVRIVHLHGVAHCDIGSDNLLFKDRNFRLLKLIDFGISEYRPEWATNVHEGFEHSKWFRPKDLEPLPDDLRPNDIIGLGRILHGIMCGNANPKAVSDRIRKMQTVFRPRTDIFDAAAMDLLCKIGPQPFGPEDGAQSIDEIRAHPWINWENFVVAPWEPPDHGNNQLNQDLAELRNDLTVLQRLLKEWMVLRLKPVQNEEAIARDYKVVGRVDRNQVFAVLDVVDSMTASRKMEMRFIFGTMTGKPQVFPQAYETKDPPSMYLELLIILRILPAHERFVNVRNVFVNRQFVAMVRERMEGSTMLQFFVHHARNNISQLVFRQLVETVRFMHLHGVVHMDLHPQHIVWETTNPHSSWKIVNFGKARFVPEMALLRHERFQPHGYLTSELLQLSAHANIQVDITALGRILHGMLAGAWEPDPAKCRERFPRRDIFDDAASDLLSRIGPEPFGPSPRGRTITIEEICHHPWLQKKD